MTDPKKIKFLLYLSLPILIGVVILNTVTKRAKRVEARKTLSPLKQMDSEAIAQAMRTGNMDPASYTVPLVMEHLRRSDIAEVRRLVLTGEDPNEQDIFGRSVLSMAAGFGEVELVKWLLAHGADVNKLNKYGVNPLISAILDVEQTSMKGYKEPAVYPAERPVFRRGSGVSPGARSTGFSLFPASTRKHGKKAFLECLELMIAKGAAVNAADAEGHTPLYFAASDPDMFLLLLEKGATWRSPFPSSKSSLFGKAGNDGLRVVLEKLLPHLAEITAEERGWLLKGALSSRRKGLAQLLIAKGCAKVDMSSVVTTLTILHYAEGLRMLKQEGVPIPEANLRQALEASVRDGVLIDAQILLEMGASPNFVGSLDCTPLTRAISLSDPEMAEILIKHGADTRMRDGRGKTPREMVITKDDNFKLLVSKGVK